MGRRRSGEPPKLCRQKSSGQGYITLDKRRIYLGPFGSAECRRRYRAELQAWEEREKPREVRKGTLFLGKGATVRELVRAYMREVADTRYRMDGEHTSTWRLCQTYLERGLLLDCGDLLADEFRHPEFEEFRRAYLQKGYSRNSMRLLSARVLALFRWGHRRGAVSAETLTSLQASPDPEEGEERDAIDPVDPEIFQKVLETLRNRPNVRRDHAAKRLRLAAMLQVQDLVGMRPGELCRMRRDEIRQDGTVKVGTRTIPVLTAEGNPYAGWIFQPSRHKTRKKGRFVAYLIGPQARELLTPYLPAEPDGYLWRGKEAGTHLTYSCYKQSVYGACKLAGVERFAPNRLRHATASRYDRVAGLEAASKVLSHANPNTTLLYIAKSLEGITGIVEQYG